MELTFMENGRNLLVLIGERGPEALLLPGVSILSVQVEEAEWNDLLSPWPAEPVFPKAGGFGGQADRLIETIMPKIGECIKTHPGWHGVMGYSLAGLFSLYLSSKTDCFDGCASVSGSLWYPGFTEYLRDHPLHAQSVYLSLGEREKETKNARMKTVEAKTLLCRDLLSAYTETVFELNPGGHFQEPKARMKRALKKLTEMGTVS